MHFQEYGNSWRHALLITAAGASFGWMRYRTGSTKAAAVMHSAYNCVFCGAGRPTSRGPLSLGLALNFARPSNRSENYKIEVARRIGLIYTA